jgi:hypothetical protein
MKQIRKVYRVVTFTPFGVKVNNSSFIPYRSVIGWNELVSVLIKLELFSDEN